MYKSVTRVAIFFAFFTLCLVVSGNVYISQQYPETFFDLVYRRERSAAYSVLTSLRGTQIYVKQLPLLSDLVGYDLSQYFVQKEMGQKARIARLFEILEKNPNNPQILTAIAIEYKKGAQDTAADEYYSRALLIDPFVSVPELEKSKYHSQARPR